jgi:TPR repeat protein
VATPASSADLLKGRTAYENGDYATALREWTPIAEQGNAVAQYYLGQMYAEGQGVSQNDKTAMKWYRRSASYGNRYAKDKIEQLTIKIQNEIAAKKAAKKAAKVLKQATEAAEKGDAYAQYILGWKYQYGHQGFPMDIKTAVKWYRRAAKQGDADAQTNLGVMYAEGQGVSQNDKTALKWYRLAAEQGDARAKKKYKELSIKIQNELAAKKAKKAREKQSVSNPGFRDLKPGLHYSTIRKKNLCGNLSVGTTCYDLDNLKFRGIYDKQGHLTRLTVDLGPIVGSVGIIDELATYLQKGETNIYLKMRTALGKKYKLDFEYSERDRQLFNKSEKKELYTVYEKGQVALLIKRQKKNYSHELWLYIEYRDVKPAEVFFKSAKPKRAKKSDF